MADVEVTVRVSGDTAVKTESKSLMNTLSSASPATGNNGVLIKITVQGVALWIDRGGFYDVLFPNDGLTGDKHHFVTWDVPELPGSDLIVDLRDGDWMPADNATYKTERWISLPIEPGSPAANPEGILWNRGACVGVLRLPYGRISHNNRKFYCLYSDDGLYYWLSSYVDWEGSLAGATAIQAVVSKRDPHAPNTTRPIISSRKFTVKCLSKDDREPRRDDGEVDLDTSDFGLLGALVSAKGMKLQKTLKHSGKTYPGPVAPAISPDGKRTTDIKLCPSVGGYLVSE
jgi:hypothetical protein